MLILPLLFILYAYTLKKLSKQHPTNYNKQYKNCNFNCIYNALEMILSRDVSGTFKQGLRGKYLINSKILELNAKFDRTFSEAN